MTSVRFLYLAGALAIFLLFHWILGSPLTSALISTGGWFGGAIAGWVARSIRARENKQ